MNEALANNDLANCATASELEQRERLSALADGELHGDELGAALVHATGDDGLATWQLYHLVGDVLRSSDLARPADPSFLTRLRAELDKEPPLAAPPERPQPGIVLNSAVPAHAANESVFRWKMVAGVASLAAVVAIGWTSVASLQVGAPAAGGAQLAQSSEHPSVASGAQVIAVAEADGQHVMIRDPRLDELLAAHKQFGSTSALQMPAGFLRNATFETPSR